MTVADLKKILATMNDTEEVIFQVSNIDPWSGHYDGYRTVDIARVTDQATLDTEAEEEEREFKAWKAERAKEIIAMHEDAIKRCRSEKSIAKHQAIIDEQKKYL